MKLISLYVLNDVVLLHPQQQTTAGFWVPSKPYLKLKLCDSRRVAENIVQLIEATHDRTDSYRPKEQLRPLLELAECSTWSELARSTKLILIENENGKLRFIPQIYEKKSTAFKACDRALEVEIDQIENIQRKIKEALEYCSSD